MRILAFSDLHRDRAATQRIVELSRQVDVVVGAGDYATVRRGLQSVIEILSAIERPTVLVCGNSEDDRELREACRDWSSAHVLHGDGVEIDGVPFFGLGGAVPITPFGAWSFDLSEQEAEALLSDCPSGCVLISHSPPKGLVDVSSTGISLGSFAVLRAIESKEPRLVICGHIHESSGKKVTHGKTVVLNAGPGGMIVEI
ncbi:MAG: metallophosphoesterase family protein [Acidobacteriota bacterium]